MGSRRFIFLMIPMGVAIINAACTFLIPITYPATVKLDMFIGEVGRSSLTSWYELRVEGDDRLYAEGSSKIVWMNHSTGRSAPLPEALRTHLHAWLVVEHQGIGRPTARQLD